VLIVQIILNLEREKSSDEIQRLAAIGKCLAVY
jgi:hypothetical protein